VNKYVDRPSEMKQLEDTLFPRRRIERRKILIFHGLGGIGKTQLSVEFARRYWRRYSSTFWLDGRTEDSLRRSIVAIAKQIPEGQIPETSRSYIHGSGEDLDGVDLDGVIRDVLDWLSIYSNMTWLLIVDNVDRDYMSIRYELAAYNIEQYFPRADHGSILVTTRLSNLGQFGTTLKLTVMDETQARSMMTSNLDRTLEGMY
jgi:hypothetical protein